MTDWRLTYYTLQFDGLHDPAQHKNPMQWVCFSIHSYHFNSCNIQNCNTEHMRSITYYILYMYDHWSLQSIINVLQQITADTYCVLRITYYVLCITYCVTYCVLRITFFVDHYVIYIGGGVFLHIRGLPMVRSLVQYLLTHCFIHAIHISS